MEEFCRVLKSEGVTVRRPEPIRWDQLGTFRTPYFEDGGKFGITGIYHIKVRVETRGSAATE